MQLTYGHAHPGSGNVHVQEVTAPIKSARQRGTRSKYRSARKNARRFSARSTPYILFPYVFPYFIAFPSISAPSFSPAIRAPAPCVTPDRGVGETLKPRVNSFATAQLLQCGPPGIALFYVCRTFTKISGIKLSASCSFLRASAYVTMTRWSCIKSCRELAIAPNSLVPFRVKFLVVLDGARSTYGVSQILGFNAGRRTPAHGNSKSIFFFS